VSVHVPLLVQLPAILEELDAVIVQVTLSLHATDELNPPSDVVKPQVSVSERFTEFPDTVPVILLVTDVVVPPGTEAKAPLNA